MNGSAVAPAAIAEESSASSRSLMSPSAIFCELRHAVQHLVTEVMSAHRALVRPFGHSFATGRTLNGVVARCLTFEQPHRIRLTIGRAGRRSVSHGRIAAYGTPPPIPKAGHPISAGAHRYIQRER
jgi:hypothetical protein